MFMKNQPVPNCPKRPFLPQLYPKSSLLLTGVTVKLTPLTYTRSVGLAPPPGLDAHLIERHRYETSLLPLALRSSLRIHA